MTKEFGHSEEELKPWTLLGAGPGVKKKNTETVRQAKWDAWEQARDETQCRA